MGHPANLCVPNNGDAVPSDEVSCGWPGTSESVHASPPSSEYEPLPSGVRIREAVVVPPGDDEVGAVGSTATNGSMPCLAAPPSFGCVSPSAGAIAVGSVEASMHSSIPASFPRRGARTPGPSPCRRRCRRRRSVRRRRRLERQHEQQRHARQEQTSHGPPSFPVVRGARTLPVATARPVKRQPGARRREAGAPPGIGWRAICRRSEPRRRFRRHRVPAGRVRGAPGGVRRAQLARVRRRGGPRRDGLAGGCRAPGHDARARARDRRATLEHAGRPDVPPFVVWAEGAWPASHAGLGRVRLLHPPDHRGGGARATWRS